MEQINIFDELYPKYVLNENKKTRLITLFSGYDSQLYKDCDYKSKIDDLLKELLKE